MTRKQVSASPFHLSASTQRWQSLGIFLVLAALIFAVFGQTLGHGFANCDDPEYVVNNPIVTQGLTFKGVVWAFSFHAVNWHPLTWLSHMLDCQIYGLRAWGHHLTNVLLHTATVIFLYLVLCQMTGSTWPSFFVAAVFAIHPLHVESVAWVAERKDVLSGLFFVLTIGAYVFYTHQLKSRWRYGLVMILFALGLMSKPMIVTLPLVVLLLDYWPLRRTESIGTLLCEKLPLLALSAASCVLTLMAQKTAIQSTESYSLASHLANALISYVVYLHQTIWPARLALFYPYVPDSLPLWKAAGAAAVLLAISAVAWRKRQTLPWLWVGWTWYLVMLVPVSEIVQVGSQSHADRYTYLPQIGLCLMIAWSAAQQPFHRTALGSLMVIILAGLMFCAWHQTSYWRDDEVLWSHTLDCTADNYMAESNLGGVLMTKGRPKDAMAHLVKSIQINPNYVQPHFTIGSILLDKGSVDDAIAQLQLALHLEPNYAEIHDTLGTALLRKGRTDEAASQFAAALQLNPDYAQAYYNLGNVLFEQGRMDDAISHFQRSLELEPGYAQAHVNLGDALLQKGQLNDALPHYERALQLDSNCAPAHVNLGNILLHTGRLDDAISHLQRAVQIKPDMAEGHSSLASALSQKGRLKEAIAEFHRALQLLPNDPGTENNLAWLLATCPDASLRNGTEAVALAEKANGEVGGKNAVALRTLAASYAAAGRFADAARSAQQAISLAQAAGQTQLAQRLDIELKSYENGVPIHQ